jgi:predicted nucleic acid-binding protein
VIVLDTNVISELMRPAPDERVVRWVDRFLYGEVFITAITAGELLHGVARLPAGHRKDLLAARVSELLNEDFNEQIMPFDHLAAEHYARLTATRENQGLPISMADAQIAATCRRYGASLATRNATDFADTGVTVLDPWEESPLREP